MLVTNVLTMQLLLGAAIHDTVNCGLSKPPADAGEIQVHGIILYLYPRSHTITDHYDGCQTRWFLDDDHFRKLNVVHYKNGIASAYDNININGDIAYHCQYEDQEITSDSDGRCPVFKELEIKSYQAGCYIRSELDNSGSYRLASKNCKLR